MDDPRNDRSEFEDGTELTPGERAAFESLRDAGGPDPALRRRVVRALRDEGLLAPGGPAREAHESRAPHIADRRLSLRWWMAAAAALALFAGGLAAGHVLEGRGTRGAVADRGTGASAALVQRTGSSYVAALQALAESRPATGASPAELVQGREVARAILYASALELARLDPEDPRPAAILRILSTESRPGSSPPTPGPSRTIQF